MIRAPFAAKPPTPTAARFAAASKPAALPRPRTRQAAAPHAVNTGPGAHAKQPAHLQDPQSLPRLTGYGHLKAAQLACNNEDWPLALQHLRQGLNPQLHGGPGRLQGVRDCMCELTLAAAAAGSWDLVQSLLPHLPSAQHTLLLLVEHAHQQGMLAQLHMHTCVGKFVRASRDLVSLPQSLQFAERTQAWVGQAGAPVATWDMATQVFWEVLQAAHVHTIKANGVDPRTRNALLTALHLLRDEPPPSCLRSALHHKPLRQLLVSLIEASQVHGEPPAQLRSLLDMAGDLPHQHTDPAALLAAVRTYHAEGPAHAEALAAAFAAAGSLHPRAQLATAHQVLAAVAAHPTAALASCRNLHLGAMATDHARGWEVFTLFAAHRDLTGTLCAHATASGDADLLQRLLPLLQRQPDAQARARSLEVVLQRGASTNALPFFTDRCLKLEHLQLSQLETLVRSATPLAQIPGESPVALAALVHIQAGFAGPELAHILAAWRVTLPAADLAQAFNAAAREDFCQALSELAQDPTRTPNALLLAAALLACLPAAALQEPRLRHLLQQASITRHTQRLRQLLCALLPLQEAEPVYRAALHDILRGPSDAQLRSGLHAEVTAALQAHAASLQAASEPNDTTAARQARAHHLHVHGLLLLHAAHLHAQGEAAAYAPVLAAVQEGLRAQVQSLLGAALPPVQAAALALLHAAQDAQANLQNLQQRCKAVGRAAHRGPPMGQHVHALCGLLVNTEQTRRRLQRAAKTTLPARDFLLGTPNAAVQECYTRDILPAQLEQLASLSALTVLAHAPQEPQHLPSQVLRALGIAQPADQARILSGFRNRGIFWALTANMLRQDDFHAAGLCRVLQAQAAGTYHAERRQSVAMTLLVRRAPASLLHAWEAGAQQPYQGSVPAWQGFTLEDTGHFADLASCGDEVTGSCNTQFGGAFRERVLGRLLCGSKRMLTLKAADGSMQARVMFRLVEDMHSRQALLLSQTYSQDPAHQMAAADALRTFGLARAAALGLPLVSAYEHSGELFGIIPYRHAAVPEYWDEGIYGEPVKQLEVYRIAATAARSPANR